MTLLRRAGNLADSSVRRRKENSRILLLPLEHFSYEFLKSSEPKQRRLESSDYSKNTRLCELLSRLEQRSTFCKYNDICED